MHGQGPNLFVRAACRRLIFTECCATGCSEDQKKSRLSAQLLPHDSKTERVQTDVHLSVFFSKQIMISTTRGTERLGQDYFPYEQKELCKSRKRPEAAAHSELYKNKK